MKKMLILIFLLAPIATLAQWSYSSKIDRMTSKEVKTAVIKSANSLSLGFPYRGANYGRIFVRQQDGEDVDAFVVIDKGQTLCSQGCAIKVRFDDNPPISLRAGPASDHSSQVVFIDDPIKLILPAKTAKKILIEMGFFHNGNQILEFKSSRPILWDVKLEPTKKSPPATIEDVGCSLASTSTKGDCGVNFAQCHGEFGGLIHEARKRYMETCLGEGLDIAIALRDIEFKIGAPQPPAR